MSVPNPTPGTPTPTPAPAGGSTPSPTPDWRQALPEALRGDAALQGYADVGALAQAHVERLKAEAAPEQPDAYTFEAKEWDAPLTTRVKALLHEAKVRPTDAPKVAQVVQGLLADAKAAVEKSRTEATAADAAVKAESLSKLKAALGDRHDPEVEGARRLLLTVAQPDVVTKALEELPLLGAELYVPLLRALVKGAAATVEQPVPPGTPRAGGGEPLSREERLYPNGGRPAA